MAYLVTLSSQSWSGDKGEAKRAFLSWVSNIMKYQGVSREDGLDFCFHKRHDEPLKRCR